MMQTIIEYVDRIVPLEDKEVLNNWKKFKRMGSNNDSTEVIAVDTLCKGKSYCQDIQGRIVDADVVLAVGIKSNIENQTRRFGYW